MYYFDREGKKVEMNDISERSKIPEEIRTIYFSEPGSIPFICPEYITDECFTPGSNVTLQFTNTQQLFDKIGKKK